jgi:hypothetical protein
VAPVSQQSFGVWSSCCLLLYPRSHLESLLTNLNLSSKIRQIKQTKTFFFKLLFLVYWSTGQIVTLLNNFACQSFIFKFYLFCGFWDLNSMPHTC